jgi:hypothetical protein
LVLYIPPDYRGNRPSETYTTTELGAGLELSYSMVIEKTCKVVVVKGLRDRNSFSGDDKVVRLLQMMMIK